MKIIENAIRNRWSGCYLIAPAVGLNPGASPNITWLFWFCLYFANVTNRPGPIFLVQILVERTSLMHLIIIIPSRTDICARPTHKTQISPQVDQDGGVPRPLRYKEIHCFPQLGTVGMAGSPPQPWDSSMGIADSGYLKVCHIEVLDLFYIVPGGRRRFKK